MRLQVLIQLKSDDVPQCFEEAIKHMKSKVCWFYEHYYWAGKLFHLFCVSACTRHSKSLTVLRSETRTWHFPYPLHSGALGNCKFTSNSVLRCDCYSSSSQLVFILSYMRKMFLFLHCPGGIVCVCGISRSELSVCFYCSTWIPEHKKWASKKVPFAVLWSYLFTAVFGDAEKLVSHPLQYFLQLSIKVCTCPVSREGNKKWFQGAVQSCLLRAPSKGRFLQQL